MDYLNHLYGRDIKTVKKLQHGTVHTVKTRNGMCYVTSYRIFPGVNVMFNDIHTDTLRPPSAADLLNNNIKQYELNHCREGAFESILKDGTQVSMNAGDFAINPLENCSQHSRFPIRHYHGISIYIIPAELGEEARTLQQYFCIDYGIILEHLCKNGTLFLKRATPELDHIFQEMYHVPEEIAVPYLKVKIQELFLYLSILKSGIDFTDREYAQKNNREIIKRLHQFVIKNSNKNYSYAQLSAIFHIKTTTMKTCYKSVYGTTIHEAVKKARLQKAIDLLKNSSANITEIALEIGYSSHAKFSEAFKQTYNLRPSEYKKIIRHE